MSATSDAIPRGIRAFYCSHSEAVALFPLHSKEHSSEIVDIVVQLMTKLDFFEKNVVAKVAETVPVQLDPLKQLTSDLSADVIKAIAEKSDAIASAIEKQENFGNGKIKSPVEHATDEMNHKMAEFSKDIGKLTAGLQSLDDKVEGQAKMTRENHETIASSVVAKVDAIVKKSEQEMAEVSLAAAAMGKARELQDAALNAVGNKLTKVHTDLEVTLKKFQVDVGKIVADAKKITLRKSG